MIALLRSAALAVLAVLQSAAATVPSFPLFPNAPTAAGWRTMGELQWSRPVPLRQDPVYEPDDGLHIVDYSDDDPDHVWGRQTAIVEDRDVPGNVATVLEMRLPVGLTGGYAATKIGSHPDWRGDGPLTWNPALNTGHLYVGFYVRFSPHFDLNRNVGQKILYLKSDRPENAAIAHMVGIMMADGVGGNQLWPTYGPQHPFARYQVAETPANDLNDGRWHLVEFLQGPNTPGVADGTLRLWVDGQLKGQWTDAVFFEAGMTPSVNRIEINPIYGGGNHPVVTPGQFIRLGPMLIRSR